MCHGSIVESTMHTKNLNELPMGLMGDPILDWTVYSDFDVVIAKLDVICQELLKTNSFF